VRQRPGCLSGWFSGWFSGCLSGWFSAWFSACLSGWFSGCLSACLSACLSGWFSGWFCGCLSGCLSGWFSGCLSGCFVGASHLSRLALGLPAPAKLTGVSSRPRPAKLTGVSSRPRPAKLTGVSSRPRPAKQAAELPDGGAASLQPALPHAPAASRPLPRATNSRASSRARPSPFSPSWASHWRASVPAGPRTSRRRFTTTHLAPGRGGRRQAAGCGRGGQRRGFRAPGSGPWDKGGARTPQGSGQRQCWARRRGRWGCPPPEHKRRARGWAAGAAGAASGRGAAAAGAQRRGRRGKRPAGQLASIDGSPGRGRPRGPLRRGGGRRA
jgi:hypothetical protein